MAEALVVALVAEARVGPEEEAVAKSLAAKAVVPDLEATARMLPLLLNRLP